MKYWIMTSRPVEKEAEPDTHREKREFKGLELEEVESLIYVQGDERATGKKVSLE